MKVLLIILFFVNFITSLFATETIGEITRIYKVNISNAENTNLSPAQIIVRRINHSFEAIPVAQNKKITKAEEAFNGYLEKYCDCKAEIATLGNSFSTFLDNFIKTDKGFNFRALMPHKDIRDEEEKKKDNKKKSDKDVEVYSIKTFVTKIFDESKNIMTLISKNKYDHSDTAISLHVGDWGLFAKETKLAIFKEVAIAVEAPDAEAPDVLKVKVKFKTYGKLKKNVKLEQLKSLSDSFIETMKKLNFFDYQDLTLADQNDK